MKKFVLHIVLFLLPLLIALLILPVDHRHKYKGLLNDCFNQGLWIHDRITDNSEPIDIAFVGSSRTITGIDDSMITAQDSMLVAVNLGYCRLGRDMTYHIVKELLEHRDVQKLYIEVREVENESGHEVYPHLADTRDIFFPKSFLNRRYFGNIYNHLAYKLELNREKWFDEYEEALIRWEVHGHNSHDDTVNPVYLEQTVIQASPIGQSGLSASFAKSYIKEIAKLADQHKVELSFIYLPSFGSVLQEPVWADFYRQYGELIIPESTIFNNPSYWHDTDHLNKAGATELTSALFPFIFKE